MERVRTYYILYYFGFGGKKGRSEDLRRVLNGSKISGGVGKCVPDCTVRLNLGMDLHERGRLLLNIIIYLNTPRSDDLSNIISISS